MDKEKNTKHELIDFMEAITTGIQNEYSRIQRRVREDPGTAGDEGEENWAELLRNWLPSNYKIVTKGRIIGRDGTASPQIDVLVLKPFYPNYLHNKKLYLAAGVVAAFECKLTLRRKHIKSAFETSSIIRKLLDNRDSDPLHEMHSTIVYGLLAHSHEWTKNGSNPIENIKKAIIKDDEEYVTHPRESLDFICVSDLATWSVNKHPSFLHVDNSKNPPVIDNLPFPVTYYGVSHADMFEKGSEANKYTTPIGSFLGLLLPVLAVNDEAINNFAWHFRHSGTWRGTSTIHSHPWTMDIFSKSAKAIYQKQGLISPNNYLNIFP